jgi:hypothetical protein
MRAVLAQPPLAPRQVECTNCGGEGEIGLIVALIALVLSFASLYLTYRAHRRAELEHHAFLDEVSRRADFRVSLEHGQRSDLKVFAEPDAEAWALLVLGIKNTGTKAASDVVINVLVPDWVTNVRRTDAEGREHVETAPPSSSDEVLRDAQGAASGARYLSWREPRIGLKPHYAYYVYVVLGRALSCPIRVKVQADELPDDKDEVVEDFMVTVVRR